MASGSLDAGKAEVMLGKFLSEYIDVILDSRDPNRNLHVSCNNSLSGGRKDGVGSSIKVDLKPVCKLQTMVVDVILEQSTLDGGKVQSLGEGMVSQDLSRKQLCVDCHNTELNDQGSVRISEMIVEKWILEFDVKHNNSYSKGERNRRANRTSSLHQKLTMLLRSLYSFVRLLPAYGVFRQVRSSSNTQLSYSIKTRVSTLVIPFTLREEALMQRFKFAPVDSSCGRLCISVMYRPSGFDLVLKGSPYRPPGVASQSMSPVLITDYVGNPSVEPIRRFPTVPASCSLSSSKPSGSNDQGSQGGYLNANKVVEAMKNHAIVEKACLAVKRKIDKNHASKMSSGIILQEPSFSGSPYLSKQNAGETSNINFLFDLNGDDLADSACRSGSFCQNEGTFQCGESLPFRKSHEAIIGSLVGMLNQAAPLHQKSPNSLELSRTSQQVKQRNHINPCHKKTTADALEELKEYRDMKKDMLMQRAGSHVFVTSDSGLEPANKSDKDLGSS